MPGLLEHVFAWVCGQNPGHTWAPAGEWLPCCQRCTGLYFGAAIALALHLALRFHPGSRFLQVHGLFLAQMVLFGFHLVPQGAVVRTLSGLFFGFGLVAFLWLWPGGRWMSAVPPSRQRLGSYALGLALSAVLLPVLLVAGGAFAARFIAGLTFLGLCVLGGLALANLGLAVSALRSGLLNRGKPVPE